MTGIYSSPTFRSKNGLYLEFGLNLAGRDFVIGDIHGEHPSLIELMEKVSFNPGVDRMICAGDIVDRGDHSESVIALIREGVIYSVRGNHDQWCIDAAQGEAHPAHLKHGGEWFYKLDSEGQKRVSTDLSNLPIAISFAGPGGKSYGVVHAECASHRWDWFKEAVCGEYGQSFCDRIVFEALWRRSRFKSRSESVVLGIDKVFVGHTVVDDVMELGNVVYLDTGGCFDDGMLTLVELTDAGGMVKHTL